MLWSRSRNWTGDAFALGEDAVEGEEAVEVIEAVEAVEAVETAETEEGAWGKDGKTGNQGALSRDKEKMDVLQHTASVDWLHVNCVTDSE